MAKKRQAGSTAFGGQRSIREKEKKAYLTSAPPALPTSLAFRRTGREIVEQSNPASFLTSDFVPINNIGTTPDRSPRQAVEPFDGSTSSPQAAQRLLRAGSRKALNLPVVDKLRF
jgi:hypothetical protein